MGIIVQKYGGTSVADPDCIRRVARRVVATAKAGHQVAVVVSAMGGETDKLVALANEIGGDQPLAREYAVLLATGEQKTIAALAMAISQLGHLVRSFDGRQAGIRTDESHLRARIESVDSVTIIEGMCRR